MSRHSDGILMPKPVPKPPDQERNRVKHSTVVVCRGRGRIIKGEVPARHPTKMERYLVEMEKADTTIRA